MGVQLHTDQLGVTDSPALELILSPVTLQEQALLPTELTSPPLVTSKNCDMNPTLPIPPRGSALPRGSLLHPRPVGWELGEVLLLKDCRVVYLCQHSLVASETQCAKTPAENESDSLQTTQ